MKLTYTLTLADFKAAYRLHRKQKILRRLSFYLFPILLVVFFVGCVIASLTNHPQALAQCLSLCAGALVGSLLTPLLRFVSLRKAFIRLFPTQNRDRTSSIEISDLQIVRELSGASELKLLWSGVFGFAQDEKITLIYTNKDCFLLFPTQTMSTSQRTELRELVGRNLRTEMK